MAGKVDTGTGEENELSSGINITPLVDVCLVLVIIFIVTAQAVLDEKLDVSLPSARQKDKERGTHITITVDKEGHKTVNSKDVLDPWKEQMKLMIADEFNRSAGLAEEKRPKHVIVRADQEVKYGIVKEILKIVRDSNFVDASIATKPAK